ncbi:hypothetical protein Ddc_14185 [Ditylenchus destructor]|nr:hypothetical protein Ddc_14185 [Ditylenchus destructor]
MGTTQRGVDEVGAWAFLGQGKVSGLRKSNYWSVILAAPRRSPIELNEPDMRWLRRSDRGLIVHRFIPQ